MTGCADWHRSREKHLSVGINSDGSYTIAQPGIPGTVMRSDVEADVDSQVLRSSAYPQHKTMRSEFHDEFGSGPTLTVTHTGLPGDRIWSVPTTMPRSVLG